MTETVAHSKRIAQLSIPIPTLERIAQHVIDVKGWSGERQQQYLKTVLQQFSESRRGLPDEMSAVSDPNFIEYLLGSRWFVEGCDIPFGRIADYLDIIRAGVVKYCAETYLQRQ